MSRKRIDRGFGREWATAWRFDSNLEDRGEREKGILSVLPVTSFAGYLISATRTWARSFWRLRLPDKGGGSV